MSERKFKLKHVIENFPELKEEYSKEEVHYGVPWRLYLVHNCDYFSIYVRCEKEKDKQNPWSIEVNYKIRLFPIIGREHPQKENTRSFGTKQGWGFHRFQLWEDVVKNHMIDNTVVVECDVTILNMTGIAVKRLINFDEPTENLTDVVLKIGEQKFHVSKVALAIQSTYFKAMFFRDIRKSKRSDIVLQEVDAIDFQAFLETVYGYSNMTEENVEGILKLADRFDAVLICEKCEKFLLRSVQMDKRKKLRLADTYSLENLKDDCIDSIKTTDELREFLPNNITNLSQSTLAALLQKNLTQC